jgi:hypothetical protein
VRGTRLTNRLVPGSKEKLDFLVVASAEASGDLLWEDKDDLGDLLEEVAEASDVVVLGEDALLPRDKKCRYAPSHVLALGGVLVGESGIFGFGKKSSTDADADAFTGRLPVLVVLLVITRGGWDCDCDCDGDGDGNGNCDGNGNDVVMPLPLLIYCCCGCRRGCSCASDCSCSA